MTQYIGITIGPIVDTMMLTSTPAGHGRKPHRLQQFIPRGSGAGAQFCRQR